MRIHIDDIHKAYGKRQILRGCRLEAESGMRVGILGRNGSGKSTLLSVLAGIQRADAGSFWCDGADLITEHRLRSQTVGYVPQGTPFMEELSAWDNLLLWYTRAQLRQELENGVLAALGIGEFVKMPVHKLSGGMKKRLSIGCAMAGHPRILLMDEPGAALDLVAKLQIREYLKGFQQAGGVVILATHDLQELEDCDCLYTLKDGVLSPFAYEGDPEKLMERL